MTFPRRLFIASLAIGLTVFLAVVIWQDLILIFD